MSPRIVSDWRRATDRRPARARGELLGERVAEAHPRALVGAGALAGRGLQRHDVVRPDPRAAVAHADDRLALRLADPAPEQALEDRRHPPAALQRRQLAALGNLLVRARDQGVDLALLDALLAERRQHLADVADERAVRP